MIDIFLTALIVYLLYYFISVKRFDNYGHVKKNKNNVNNKQKKDKKMSNTDRVDDYMALPSEVKYFIKKYKVDLDKVNLHGMLKLIGFILGLDIALVSIFVLLVFKNIVIQLIVASLLIIPIYLISLKFLATNFKKRGWIKHV